jgi:D-xylono/L-arabinono-1,4-lactonase
MKHDIETVVQDNNRCGEAPIWDARGQRLVWTDISADLLFDLTPATGTKRILSRGLNVAGIALTGGDDLILAGATGLHLWRGQDDYRTIAAQCDGETFNLNDIIADPQGRVYAGSVYWGAAGMEKLGKLYLFDTDGSVRVVDDGIELANGLGFSPDDRILYFADSTARNIYAYDIDRSTGNLRNKRVVVHVPGDEGIPDGLTVDRAGFIWSAQWYGSQIVRYDPDGQVERRILMPVQQVSSLAFGGPDWTDLYVTSAGESWPSAYAPPGYDFNAPNIGGSLYRIRQDIPGRHEHAAHLPAPAK